MLARTAGRSGRLAGNSTVVGRSTTVGTCLLRSVVIEGLPIATYSAPHQQHPLQPRRKPLIYRRGRMRTPPRPPQLRSDLLLVTIRFSDKVSLL